MKGVLIKYLYKTIIVKSTVPIGTTHKVYKVIVDCIKKRNKNIKFSIVNNPEFLREGKAVSDFMSPDRIIIGLDDEEVKKTIIQLSENLKLVVEPGGAVAATALLNRKIEIKNKTIIVMISGGNIDNELFTKIISESK